MYIFPNPAAKTTLLPIVLKQFNPGTSGWSGFYSLVIPANVHVWRNPDATGAVTNATVFWANKDIPLWVEGIASGTSTLQLNWDDVLHGAVDSSKLNVFNWEGPRDVPGTSTYTYKATGGLPGASSNWIGGGNATVTVVTNPEDPVTHADTAKVTWAGGPAVGGAAYQAAPGYIWDMSVNVVRVTVANPDQGFAFFPNPLVPVYSTGTFPFPPNGNQELAARRPGTYWYERGRNIPSGLTWKAKITLTGPDGGRGVDHIESGYIQNVTSIALNATYGKSGTLVASVSSQGKLNDANPNSSVAPWYNSVSHFQGRKDSLPIGATYDATNGSYTITLEALDSPFAYIPFTLAQHEAVEADDAILTAFTFKYTFRLYVSSTTLDATVDPQPIFTTAAYADWTFDGSANVTVVPNSAPPQYTYERTGDPSGVGPAAITWKPGSGQTEIPTKNASEQGASNVWGPP